MDIMDREKYKILPYGITKIKTWPEDCFLYSLLTGSKYGNNWIADSNIQIVLTHDMFSYYPFRKQHLSQNIFDDIPFIHKYAIDRRLLHSINENFSDIVIKSIDADFYMSGLFNKRFLLEGEFESIDHVGYIYGYDEKENVVYMNDNFYHGINSCEKIPFTRVQRAFEAALPGNAMHPGNRVVNFYKINEEMEYQLSKEKIKEGMTDYLLGTVNKEDKNNEYTYFGVKAYEKFVSVIEHVGNHDIDLRNISFLCDIASVNEIRVKTMIHSGMFEINDQCLQQSIEKQMNLSTIMLGLAMKYNARKDERVIHRLTDYIKEFGKTEENIACNIIDLC